MLGEIYSEAMKRFPHNVARKESTESTFALLYGLVRFCRPEHVVEMGAHTGHSSMFLVKAIEENGCGSFVGYETQEGRAVSAGNKLRALFGESVDWNIVVADGATHEGPVDFLFLDIDPKAAYVGAFLAVRDSMPVGAVLCAHDLIFGDEGKHVEALIEHLGGWDVMRLEKERGMLVAVKRP